MTKRKWQSGCTNELRTERIPEYQMPWGCDAYLTAFHWSRLALGMVCNRHVGEHVTDEQVENAVRQMYNEGRKCPWET